MYDKWIKIIESLKSNPRDLHTDPKVNKDPLWFYASADISYIYVSNAREHKPSSNITSEIKLGYSEFIKIYPVYLRREQGQSVSAEAQKVSHNQVYWYGIFKFCLD